nr:tyrosine-type recombinase/integrase [Streptomyces sp. NBC_00830]WTB35764.1 tyrosine-type recombinase/integrase [Streptomyces sp. NBC_00830]
MAYTLALRPPGERRTWTVVGEDYKTVAPVEEWLEAHRRYWSPNTVRSYATSLAQWWTFLEQRDETAKWNAVGVPAVAGYLSWLRNGRTVEHVMTAPEDAPTPETLEARLGALISFYKWQDAINDVPVAAKILRGAPRRAPARGLLSHLDNRTEPGPSSLVRVRTVKRRDRPPILLPQKVQAILDGCATYDPATGEWVGNLRDRFLFALLAETGMRIGEALGMRIHEFVMGRGGTPHIEIVPREDNPNDARVKMLRPRRVYVGSDLERLYADYLTMLAMKAAGSLPQAARFMVRGSVGAPSRQRTVQLAGDLEVCPTRPGSSSERRPMVVAGLLGPSLRPPHSDAGTRATIVGRLPTWTSTDPVAS